MNPPHPTRARTPPWGACAPGACACLPGCLRACACIRVHACACLCIRVRTPGYLPVRAVRLTAYPRGVPAWFPGAPGALRLLLGCPCVFCYCSADALASFVRARCACVFCVFPALPWFPGALASLLPPALLPLAALACSGQFPAPLCRRLDRCGYRCCSPLASLRGSVTIVCYNQPSALQGIAYNLAVWCNGPTLQRGTSRTAVGLTRYRAICTVRTKQGKQAKQQSRIKTLKP